MSVLDVPTWDVAAGEQLVIEGPSGCGKSTLLHVVGGLLRPTSGQVEVCGQNLAHLNESQRDHWRAAHVGIIFQTLNLLPAFNAVENVLLGATFTTQRATRAEAERVLSEVGLAGRLTHRPAHMSLGEQQRVAIARAVIKRPQLILADEPTGSLDPANARDIAALLRQICADHGCTLVMVCHQPEIAAGFPQRKNLGEINRLAVNV